MSRVLLLLFLVSSALIVFRDGSSPSGPGARVYVNGEWCNGRDFQSTTFYTVDGILTKRKPNGPVETVDLQGGFVVPAFADVHNHFPSSMQDLATANRAYWTPGSFMCSTPEEMRNRPMPFENNEGRPRQLTSSSRTLCSYVPAGTPRRTSNTSWTREFSLSTNQNLKGIFSTPSIRLPKLRRFGPNTSLRNQTL
jgi:hypothetical protein